MKEAPLLAPVRRGLLPIAVVALISGSLVALVLASDVHWDYYSHGGASGWGRLAAEGLSQPAFPDCNLAEQSPVNLQGVPPRLGGLSLDYDPTPLVVTNNGHTIQVNYAAGSTMAVEGKPYSLLQFHFHSPSEHEVGGARTPLELHLVHRAADGEYAVLGVILAEGGANAAFEEILSVMPSTEGMTSTHRSLNAVDLLPADLAYYSYDGSFTTPPCTEGVKWYVLNEAVTVSREQVVAFRKLEFLHHDGHFVGNARPVQPLNDRLIRTDTGSTPAPPRITSPVTGNAGLVAAPGP